MLIKLIPAALVSKLISNVLTQWLPRRKKKRLQGAKFKELRLNI